MDEKRTVSSERTGVENKERKQGGQPFHRSGNGAQSGERTGRPQGAKKPYANRPQGGRKPYGSKPGAPRPAAPVQPPKTFSPTPARRAALDALLSVSDDGAYSGLALDAVLKKYPLSDVDRALCTQIFYGVLEKRLYLDHAIAPYMKKPFDDQVIVEILRMAVYQGLFLDRIPENAICSEAVELTRLRGREAFCSPVNAILRAFFRSGGMVRLPEDPLERLSLETSTPMPLLKRLIDTMGSQEALAFLSEKNDGPATVRRSTLRISAEKLEEWFDKNGYKWEPSFIANAYRVTGGGLATSEAFYKGWLSFIGESSMLACHALGVKNGQRVFDCCAAPGGKTCYIAELMSNTGRVMAMDVHAHRVELIDNAAHRLGLDNVRARLGDASVPREELFGSMDAVIVDAPCSGLGVLRNKPDIKYTIDEESLNALPAKQLAILTAASGTVKPGGTLVYCTCTVLRSENESVVERFLASNSDFELCGLEGLMPEELRGDIDHSMLQILPQRDGIDGFFIARMVRKGERRR